MKDPNALVTLDEQGHIRHIDHSAEPYDVSKTPKSPGVAEIAAQYIKEVLAIKNVLTKVAESKTARKPSTSKKADTELILSEVKQLQDLVIVTFQQYVRGIPLWRTGTTVLVDQNSLRILSASNSFDYNVSKVKWDARFQAKHPKEMTPERLSEIISWDRNLKRVEVIKKDLLKKSRINEKTLQLRPVITINQVSTVLYRYNPEKRKHSHGKKGHADQNLVDRALDIYLKDVKNIKAGDYRAVSSVFFSTSIGEFSLNWHALIDQATDSVLYIRALVELAEGFVYDKDPLSITGSATITPGSTTAILNVPRNPRPLARVTGLPNLKGQYVSIEEICPIVSTPPTSASGTFNFNANTDDFTAVNAYYHNDFAFRMVEEMGFNASVYFNGVTFPVRVDHRGCFGCVNAAAWGNSTSNGISFLTYGVVEAGKPVGIATDVRIVLHEFGHVILLDHVDSGNLGFAHSCGDSLAALYGDPGSKAPDRGLTFPWLTQSNPSIDRRHDRDILSGWAWGGVNDDGGYGSEQILATSHFRAYLSLGGNHRDMCEREWASRYLLYLIIRTVGTLTPLTNPSSAEAWSDLMQVSDKSTTVFEGHAGGAVHKVIRWAFERQGAYQLPGTPTPVTTPGVPPAIDIYINDGRNGEYDFTTDFCHTTDIWNRICPDGHPAHQMPIPGFENYAYVIVRNRGISKIESGTVRAFQKRENACCDCCDDCHNLRWPNDFMPMITQSISFNSIPPGGYAIVGPFKWKPFPGDCMLMIADTKGDLSNIAYIKPGQSILAKRLVPFDNNIALRCICEECNPDYSKLMLRNPCQKR